MSFQMNNLRKKSDKELEKEFADKHDQLREVKFALAGNSVKNVCQIRTIKKEIARILTSFSERKNNGKEQ